MRACAAEPGLDGAELGELRVSAAELRRARRVAAGAARGPRAAIEKSPVSMRRSFPQAEYGDAAGRALREPYPPTARRGLYVPAIRTLPSAVIMLAVPARLPVAPERVLCTPPQRDGTAHPAILAARLVRH